MLKITIREDEAATTLEFDELLDSTYDPEGVVVEAFKRSLRAVRDIAKLYNHGVLNRPVPQCRHGLILSGLSCVQCHREAMDASADRQLPDPTKCSALPVPPPELDRFHDDGGPVA